MVLYSVYRAKFLTTKNTMRFYIGFTGNASKREDKLGLGEMPWTSCMKKGTLQLGILYPDIESKGVARALEAWEAARHIDNDAEHVRGGPWLMPSLPPSDKFEVSVVGRCKSLSQLADAKELLGKNSRFAKHMDDLLFGDPVKSSAKAPPAVKSPTVAQEPALSSAAPPSSTTSARASATSSTRAGAASTSTKAGAASKVRLPRPVQFVLDRTLKKPRSGTQFSGARRRFNKLPTVKKKPAAARKR